MAEVDRGPRANKWVFLVILSVALPTMGIGLIVHEILIAENLERQAFEIIDGRAPTIDELVIMCDRFPRTDAGGRLAVQAAICLGLPVWMKEFEQHRPEQLPQVLSIALEADETAFGADAEARLAQAKRNLRSAQPTSP